MSDLYNRENQAVSMRKLCREIFGTDHPEDLKEIAQKAQKYDLLMNKERPVNERNAGRKALFDESQKSIILDMYRQGVSIKTISRHFHTSRQTIYKYIETERRKKDSQHME